MALVVSDKLRAATWLRRVLVATRSPRIMDWKGSIVVMIGSVKFSFALRPVWQR